MMMMMMMMMLTMTIGWIMQDLHDEIFATPSRRSQFMNEICAHCIREYYGGRRSEKKGIYEADSLTLEIIHWVKLLSFQY